MQFQEKYGPWAIVTGAGRGIGREFAYQLANKNINLILVDILKEELTQTEIDLSKKFPIQIKKIVADFNQHSDVMRVIQECETFSIGLVCSNHAMTQISSDGKLKLWLNVPLENLYKMITVNLTATITLLHHFAKKMKPNGHGGIIIVSALSGALSGTPYIAQYAATKAFLVNLGETLWWELKQDGIDVLTVLPGLTKTEVVKNSVTDEGVKEVSMMEPKPVVTAALNALGKKIKIIPGWKNVATYVVSLYFLPRKFLISKMGEMMPRYFKT